MRGERECVCVDGVFLHIQLLSGVFIVVLYSRALPGRILAHFLCLFLYPFLSLAHPFSLSHFLPLSEGIEVVSIVSAFIHIHFPALSLSVKHEATARPLQFSFYTDTVS